MCTYSRVSSVLLLTAATSMLSACSKVEEPRSFEDCILQKTPTTKTVDALTLVKVACKGKFPKSFDFDAIASGASVSVWRDVALKPDFSNLPEAEKSEARKQYFESVVMPRVDPAYVEDARTQFEAFFRQIERAAASAPPASTSAKP